MNNVRVCRNADPNYTSRIPDSRDTEKAFCVECKKETLQKTKHHMHFIWGECSECKEINLINGVEARARG